MAVKVRCPGCQKSLTVPDEARGKSVKCPSCEVRVPIPGEKPAKKPKAVAAAPADSADALATLDLRKAEDRQANVCRKCGTDLPEETTECSECGFDSALGELGVVARKKLLKGPDPDEFTKGIWKDSWKFVGKNIGLAWRSVGYSLGVFALVSLTSFMYLYMYTDPPRYFFAFLTVVFGLIVPGWYWFLDVTVIQAAMEKKEKLKRVNFDFALCSTFGLYFVAWHVIFAGPVLAIPAAIGYALVEFAELPTWVIAVALALGYLPVLTMFPTVMTHMSMPISYPGWLVWKILPIWNRLLKPSLVCGLLSAAMLSPAIGGLAAIGGVWGEDLAGMVATMNENAAKKYKEWDKAQNPKKGTPGGVPKEEKLDDVDFSVLIYPAVISSAVLIWLGFALTFLARIHGRFAYFFKLRLDLLSRAKEVKYKQVIKRGDDGKEFVDDEIKETTFTDAIIIQVICQMMGLMGGLLTSALGNYSMGYCLLNGWLIGCGISVALAKGLFYSLVFDASFGWWLAVKFIPFGEVAFVATHWEQSRMQFSNWMIAIVIFFTAFATAAVNETLWFLQEDDKQGVVAPVGPMQGGGMPGGGMPGGAMPGGPMPGGPMPGGAPPGGAPPAGGPPAAPPNPGGTEG